MAGALPQTLARSWPGPELCEAWRRAAGEHLARRSFPVRLEEQTLVVAGPSAAWRQELTLLAPQLLDRLRAAGLALSGLRVVTAATPPPPAPAPHLPELDQAERQELARQVAHLQDPGLRQAALRLLETQAKAGKARDR